MRLGLIAMSVVALLAGVRPAAALPPATWNDPYAPKTDWLSGAHRAQSRYGPQSLGRAPWPGAGEPQTWRPLVILVEFPDKPRKGTKAYFEDMLFGRHPSDEEQLAKFAYPHPSMADQYAAMSGERLTFEKPAIVDWIMAPQPYTYYTGYSGSVPAKGCYGLGNGSLVMGATELVRWALGEAEARGHDIATFGVGDDAAVEGIFIVHAGAGAEQTSNPDEFPCKKESVTGNTIQAGDLWSHQYRTDFTPGGGTSKVVEYLLGPAQSASNETATGLSPMGVWAHEFGHMLNLPDLYASDVADGYGIGCWDLMGYAIRSCSNEHMGEDPGMDPNEMSVWTRMVLGWSEPREVKENLCNRVVEPLQYGGETFKVVPDADRPHDYFLIEYRAAVGLDKDLVNFSTDNHNRVCVYHIDETIATISNTLPNDACGSGGHYGVALVEADDDDSLCTAAAYVEAGDCMLANTKMSAAEYKSMRTWAGTGAQWTIATGGLNDTARISITVDPSTPVVAPNIVGTPDDAVRGDTWRYRPRVAEASGLAQWSLEEYPSGMTIDADSGAISWRVPPGFSASKVKVTVNVSNCGGEDEQTFNLAVVDPEAGCGCASKSGPSAADAVPVALFGAFFLLVRRRLRLGARRG